MTLPEHAICSFMLAQLGPREKFGKAGVVLVTLAGISPDLDTAAKLVGDQYFWQLHHALGHSLLSITVLALCISGIGVCFAKVRPFWSLFAWCWLAAFVHCVTDSFYWWGVKPLWPFADVEVTLSILEYIDLFVLGIWLVGVWRVYRQADHHKLIAVRTLVVFFAYVGVRAALPKPSGVLSLLMGNWMYAIEQGTPVLDWW